jgi:hypothetical protein
VSELMKRCTKAVAKKSPPPPLIKGETGDLNQNRRLRIPEERDE